MPGLRHAAREGIVIETKLTGSDVIGARMLIQIDGDVLLFVHSRFLDDAAARAAHEQAVQRRLAALDRYRAMIRAMLPVVGTVSAAAIAFVHHELVAIGPAVLAAWSMLRRLLHPSSKPSNGQLASRG